MTEVLHLDGRGVRAFTHAPSEHPGWDDPCQPPAEDVVSASQHSLERLLHELRQAGLSEDQASAEAPRLLAGDVWGG